MRHLLLTAGLIFTAFAAAGAQSPFPQNRGSSVQGNGTLLPKAIVEVNSVVQGKIQKIHPAGEFNAIVKKGDPLAELDSASFEADFRLAKASVELADAEVKLAKARAAEAQRELDRARELGASGLAGRPEIDKRTGAVEIARAELAVAEAKAARSKASLDRARIDLDACVLRAPIDGVVIDRRAAVGQITNPSASAASLFLVASDQKLEVAMLVRAADVARVSKGQAARIKVDAYPNETFKGEVAQVRMNAAMQKEEVFYTVIVRTDKGARRLIPYMTAQVTIETGDAK